MSAASPISLVSSDDEPTTDSKSQPNSNGSDSGSGPDKTKPFELPSQIYTVSSTTTDGYPYYRDPETYTSVLGAYIAFEDARHAAWKAMGDNRDGNVVESGDTGGGMLSLRYSDHEHSPMCGTEVQVDVLQLFGEGSVPKSKRLMGILKEAEKKKAEEERKKAERKEKRAAAAAAGIKKKRRPKKRNW